MLIIFNDPVLSEDPAGHAVRMALEMQVRFDELMGSWRKRGHDIALGIGISHGYATIGAIGYEARVGYGAIGRVTNLATRLSTEAAGGQILVSAPVHELTEPVVDAAEADQLNLSGFARPVSIYRVLGLKPVTVEKNEPAFPLKIYTLGQFALLKDSQPMAFSRKVQKRPLDLMKVLIAYGGVRIDIAGIMASMWPDAEGDAAKVAFDSNLHRLRKLIDIDDMLTLSEGRLSLDARRCWVDVWAFDELVARIDRLTSQLAAASDAQLTDLVKELLRLYAGHFIEKESQDSWAVAARDRLRSKFVRAVTALGAGLEQRKAWDQAAALYSRALELDNLAEGLYRRLMIVYRELGETAEALQVYRRCRDMLSIVLSVGPSAETEAIRATLK
jgi:two-component SAPR family response regulator